MNKQHITSIEEFAAFLDGNLPQDEMLKINQLIKNDTPLHDILDASDIVDDSICLSEPGLVINEDMFGSNFKLPEIDNLDHFPFDNDSLFDFQNLYSKDSPTVDEITSQKYEHLKNIKEMAQNYHTYGETGENLHDPIFIKQPDDHSCGLRSQQIILRDFGIDIPFEDLENYALDAGVYTEKGTYTYDIGKVLEMAGIGMHQIEEGTIFDLTNELAQGHRVIVSVDADELWYDKSLKDKMANWLNDVFGNQGGNHALIVAGVEVNPNNYHDVKVVLTDPGSGDLRIEYPLNQFMNAWRDSNCFMAATDNAAPYQYDLTTGMEVPSNFVTEHNLNQFVINNGYQLNPDMINIPLDYKPEYNGHLDFISQLFHDSGIVGDESAGSVGNLFSNNELNLSDSGESTGSVGEGLLGGDFDSDDIFNV